MLESSDTDLKKKINTNIFKKIDDETENLTREILTYDILKLRT